MIGASWHFAFRLAWDGPKRRWKRSLTQKLMSRSDFAYIPVIFFSEICDPPELKLALMERESGPLDPESNALSRTILPYYHTPLLYSVKSSSH